MGKVLQVFAVSGWLISGMAVHAEQRNAKEKTEQKETVVYTNEDLPPAPPGSSASPVTPPQASPAPSTSLAIPSYDSIRDQNGHGEGWWRQRAAELDARILEARIEAEKLHVAYVRGKTIIDPTLAPRSREATLFLKKLEAERDALPEELRRAGGLPGWLRGGQSAPSEALPPPEPEAPTHAGALTLSWKPVPLGAFYVVELQCLDCCGPIEPCEVSSRDVTGTSVQLPFEGGHSGRWRVRALDAAGAGGEWSDWQSFEHPSR